MSINPSELLSATQAAREVGLTRQTIWRATRSGELASVEVAGRKLIRRADLEAWQRKRVDRFLGKGKNID